MGCALKSHLLSKRWPPAQSPWVRLGRTWVWAKFFCSEGDERDRGQRVCFAWDSSAPCWREGTPQWGPSRQSSSAEPGSESCLRTQGLPQPGCTPVCTAPGWPPDLVLPSLSWSDMMKWIMKRSIFRNSQKYAKFQWLFFGESIRTLTSDDFTENSLRTQIKRTERFTQMWSTYKNSSNHRNTYQYS